MATRGYARCGARRGLAYSGLVWLLLCTGVGGWLLLRAGATTSHGSGRLPPSPVAYTSSGAEDADCAVRRTVNIENIRVGQRVATDGGLSNNGSVAPDASKTAVDPETWRLIQIRAEQKWPDSTRDTWEIETLQPVNWIERFEVAAGKPIELGLVLDLAEMGAPEDLVGQVVKISPTPPIETGRGRVVLTTVNHLNNFLFRLTLRDASGHLDTLGVTGWHKFYSESRGWVSASELREGESIRSRGRQVTVADLARRPGVNRVYNFTVEYDHVYYVGSVVALVHNNRCRVGKFPGPPGEFETKGMHVHASNGVELAVRGGGPGNVVLKPIYSTDSAAAVRRAQAEVQRALVSDDKFYQNLLRTTQQATKDLGAGTAQQRAASGATRALEVSLQGLPR